MNTRTFVKTLVGASAAAITIQGRSTHLPDICSQLKDVLRTFPDLRGLCVSSGEGLHLLKQTFPKEKTSLPTNHRFTVLGSGVLPQSDYRKRLIDQITESVRLFPSKDVYLYVSFNGPSQDTEVDLYIHAPLTHLQA